MGSEEKKIDTTVQKFHRMGIDQEDFRSYAKDMVDYVIKYTESLNTRQAFPDVEPGFMRPLLPDSAPVTPESWKELMTDIERIVIKGSTHWQSSSFFAFFPSATSYPAILADILSDVCSAIGFTWAAHPSCTELETVMMDWLAKAMGLPKCFWHEGKGPGAGVIQGTASEATIMTLLAARTKFIHEEMNENPSLTKHDVLRRLVAYTSKYCHSSVERGCLIGMVTVRQLDVDENISVRGETLQRAIKEDRAAGKIPFYVCATLGTTSCCSFDNIHEIGTICSAEKIWLHIDAAYAGSSYICPEFRYRMRGVELADSFNFNPHKWLMVNFDFSALWVKNSSDLINSLNVNPLYLRHENQDIAIDYRHWQIPLGRRFRSLKLWFVFRLVGIEGIQHRIREDVRLAKLFESYVRGDSRFQVVFPVELGLTCIRLVKNKEDPKENKKINEKLLKKINDSREIYIISSEVEGIYFIRVCTGAVACDEAAVHRCWVVIKKHATEILEELE